MPDFTIASAACLISVSLTLQANLFQVFQPMGGVRARLAETPVSEKPVETTNGTAINSRKRARRMNVLRKFRTKLYQICQHHSYDSGGHSLRRGGRRLTRIGLRP